MLYDAMMENYESTAVADRYDNIDDDFDFMNNSDNENIRINGEPFDYRNNHIIGQNGMARAPSPNGIDGIENVNPQEQIDMIEEGEEEDEDEEPEELNDDTFEARRNEDNGDDSVIENESIININADEICEDALNCISSNSLLLLKEEAD